MSDVDLFYCIFYCVLLPFGVINDDDHLRGMVCNFGDEVLPGLKFLLLLRRCGTFFVLALSSLVTVTF